VVQRVFIIWSHPLFYHTLHLLLRHPAIEIIGANCEYVTARVELEKLEPDIIIFEDTQENTSAGTQIWELLESNRTPLRVIRLSLDDNELRMYQRHCWTLSDDRELIRFIQGD